MGSEGFRCTHGFTVTVCSGCVKANAELSREVGELRAALELAWAAMSHMGDVLNDMDAVTSEDLVKTQKAFNLVPAVLARRQP